MTSSPRPASTTRSRWCSAPAERAAGLRPSAADQGSDRHDHGRASSGGNIGRPARLLVEMEQSTQGGTACPFTPATPRPPPSRAGLAALALTPAAAPAQPFPGPGYPKYANEGRYPEATSCKYSLQASRTASFAGRRITLKYFYNGRWGSFARIDNAPRSCRVTLDRSADGGPHVVVHHRDGGPGRQLRLHPGGRQPRGAGLARSAGLRRAGLVGRHRRRPHQLVLMEQRPGRRSAQLRAGDRAAQPRPIPIPGSLGWDRARGRGIVQSTRSHDGHHPQRRIDRRPRGRSLRERRHAGRRDPVRSARRAAATRVDGELRRDRAARAVAAEDFGHLVRRPRPASCFPPPSGDVAELIRWSKTRGEKVAAGPAPLGAGRSQTGPDGVVVDVSALPAVREVARDWVVVDAGATLERGARRDAPVRQDAAGPVRVPAPVRRRDAQRRRDRRGDRASARRPTTSRAAVVTGDGDVLACSADRRADLFDAVRAGLGSVG